MVLFYAITFAVSIGMLAVYFHIDRKRDLWLLLLFIFVAISNTGYLSLALSRSLTMALVSNTVAYLGNAFLPFFLLMMVVQLSYVRYPRWLPGLLITVNSVMFLIATSGGYLPIYYKEVSFEIIDGAAHLVKVYGPLHGWYKVFIFAYFGAIIGIICYTAVKKTAVSTKHTIFLAVVMIGNIALWLVENLTGMKFEFLTISYLMTEGLILLLYGILQDYEDSLPASEPGDLAYADVDLAEQLDQDMSMDVPENQQIFSEEQIKAVFANWTAIHTLTQREAEVLRFIFEKRKRKDIAQVLFVTESTIKKHTSNIYKKLEVVNRTELFEKAAEYTR
ncbi:MAG: hypothetical protein J6B95_08520 [Oscillospiraceae bacterium]|nr:hypothetical protein [Oscillospiraceae bacterium]